jgi:hypothetical protein
MTCNKKSPCKEEKAKSVEKLTDESLDKVSGGKNIGCQPSWSPCEPKGKVGCGPTSTPCEPKKNANYCAPVDM